MSESQNQIRNRSMEHVRKRGGAKASVSHTLPSKHRHTIISLKRRRKKKEAKQQHRRSNNFGQELKVKIGFGSII